MFGLRSRSTRVSTAGKRQALVRSGSVAAVAVALAGVLPVGAAHADPTLTTEYTGIVRNWALGHCMDAFANVNPCYDNGTDAWQQWNVMTDVDGNYLYFQNAHTGQCLDDGSGLYMYTTCIANDAAQEWVDTAGTGINYQAHFQNVLTGQCLDDDGQLYVNNCNGGGYQTWRWDGSL